MPLFAGLTRERVDKAVALREEIRAAPDDALTGEQILRFNAVQKQTAELREIGDAVVGVFFAHTKPGARDKALREVQQLSGQQHMFWDRLRQFATTLASGVDPVRPFHWELEFPEVFAGDAPGFDAMVGNPPFAGKNTLIGGHRDGYLDWLQTLHANAHGNADVVAHFSDAPSPYGARADASG